MKTGPIEQSAEPTGPGFTIENPEDYAIAEHRIEVLKGSNRNDEENAEMQSLKIALYNADFPPTVRTRNNHIG